MTVISGIEIKIARGRFLTQHSR